MLAAHGADRAPHLGTPGVHADHHVGVPFGGYKQSGMGREESIEELLACTQIKNVNVTIRSFA